MTKGAVRIAVILALVLLGAGTCDRTTEGPREFVVPEFKHSAATPGLVLAEARDRLRRFVEVRRDLLFVRDGALADLSISIFPLPVPWRVHCGLGISVIFGAGIVVGERASSPDVELLLYDWPVALDVCNEIGPVIAGDIRSVVQLRP